MKLTFTTKPKPFLLTVGTLVMSIGGGFYGFFPNTPVKIVGIILFLIGFILSLFSFIKLNEDFIIYEDWELSRIKKDLQKADNNSTLKFLQTWWPDRELLCPMLEKLMIKNDKVFNIEVFLIEYKDFNQSNSLICSRQRLRPESPEQAANEVKSTIARLKIMKERVDLHWAKYKAGAKLNLTIKLFNVLPFGSMYQIGNDVIYFGLYHNYESSAHGPMFKITPSKDRVLWNKIENNLETLSNDKNCITEEIVL